MLIFTKVISVREVIIASNVMYGEYMVNYCKDNLKCSQRLLYLAHIFKIKYNCYVVCLLWNRLSNQ